MRLVLSSIAAAALWACSSGIDLKPVDTDQGQGEDPQDVAVQPELPAVGSGGAGGASPGRAEVTEPSRLAQPGSSGAAGAGADLSMNAAGAADAGSPAQPACPDADGDGQCDSADLCPNVADDGTDRDGMACLTPATSARG